MSYVPDTSTPVKRELPFRASAEQCDQHAAYAAPQCPAKIRFMDANTQTTYTITINVKVNRRFNQI